MPSAEHTVTIARPIDEVYAFVADGTNNPRWRSGVIEISRTSEQDGLGATYRQVLTGPGGRRIDGDYRVTAYDPPRRLGFEVTAGPARPKGTFELSEPQPGRTTVRFRLELQPTGLMRLASPMIGRTMRSEVASLVRMKSVLES